MSCASSRPLAGWRWALPAARGMLLAFALLLGLLGTPPVAAQPPEMRVQGNDDWRAWREGLLELRYRDAQAALRLVRARYEAARDRGDQRAEWLHLGWLVRETAAIDFATSAPLLTLAEQAINDARRAGDRMAAFELILMVEQTRVGQQSELPREALLSQAMSLAAELGDDQREGLVWQLRGLAAAQAGQEGEALYLYQRALPLLTGQFDRAELLFNMALALFENPTAPATRQALGYLHELNAMLPPERYPSFVEALIRESLLLARSGQSAEALSTAQRAASVARQVGLATPMAQAQVALGYAYLSAREPGQAVATFRATSLEALNIAGRLSALAGWALALAQQAEPSAHAVLARGVALAQAQANPNAVAIAQFYEASSRVRQTLGDPAGALDDLARAGMLRSNMANAAREKLVQARVDASARTAEAEAESSRRRRLSLGVAVLALAVLASGGLFAYQLRQRRWVDRMAADLQQANHQLEALNAARSRHLAAACHDLRQPAHVLGLLTEDPPGSPVLSPDDLEGRVQAVQRCSRTLTDMLDALMDMTQLERGVYVPREETVDLAELLIEVDLQYGRTARGKGLSWQVQAVPAWVRSDRHLLRRVLFNLASNAVRYSAQGSVKIVAGVTERDVVVEVSDSGPGLPLDWLTRPGAGPDFGISRSGAGGLGMGLSIVRQASQLLGLDISVPVSSSRGSVVRLSLPRTLPAGGLAAGGEPRFDGQRVAVVEADPVGREALLDVLGQAGLQPRAFATWAALVQAWPAWAEGAPELIILDPSQGMAGDVEQRLPQLALPPGACPPALLLLTADERPEVAELASRLGATLARKPIGPRCLRQVLAGAMTQAAARRLPVEAA